MREPGDVTLVPGARLGPYEIVGPLGAGGMGEVHRARDPRLGRDVAIKALPPAFARDPERLARFEREAKLLASLSHPNIAGIHGLEEVAGHRYLVLEFVEGETLAARLARGPLPVREALEVCLHVAAGVEAAHESGVVHRDLKPGNVMLTARDGVKVLDFGLAKSGTAGAAGSDPNLSASPTMTYAATGAGVVLGTAAYMSPEQARGKSVDRRTDVWSFGCLLYECLSGRPLFQGETVSDLIARILEREPDWSALPPETPVRVRTLLARCLRKDPRERLRDVGDARLELAEVLASPAEPAVAAAAAAGRRPGAFAIAGWAVALLAVAAAVLPIARGGSRPALIETLRVSVLAPDGVEIVNEVPDLVISPDGRTIAFTGQDTAGVRRIWVRPLSSSVARVIPGTDGAITPFWSPDNRQLAFFAAGQLRRVSLDQEGVQAICPAPNPRGGAWGPGDVILFAPAASGPLLRVTASVGDPRPATTLDSARAEGGHRFPQFLPDGKHFLYVVVPGNDTNLDTRVGSLGDIRPGQVVLTANSMATYAAPGYLVFSQRGSIVAQRFDPGSRRLEGSPRPMREIPDTRDSYSGSPMVTVSNDGALVFREPRSTHTRLELLDLSGRVTRTLAVPEMQYSSPHFSPDGTRLVVAATRPGATESPLVMVDVARSTSTRFTFDSPFAIDGIWTPDGKWVIYGADLKGPRQVFRRRADGSGPEEQLGPAPNMFNDPNCVSPDGRFVVFRSLSGETGEDLLMLEIEGGRAAVPLIRTKFNEIDADISPDGRWIAYRSDESGRFEIYVQSFPALDSKARVSTQGANPVANANAGWTRWSPDGRSLYFVGGDGQTIMRADVESTDPFHTSEPRPVLRLPPGYVDADLTRDCRQMVVCVPEGRQGRAVANVVMGWARELEGGK